jgi:hypothetical protein
MKYPEFLSSAKRHNHACKVLKEKIDSLESNEGSDEEFKFLVLSLYYLSGYIIECSLKFKIFELSSYGLNLEINEEECLRAGIHYRSRIKTHSFTKLQDYLDSFISDISHESDSIEINKLLSNWNPEVRYMHIDLKYDQIKILYEHTSQFLKKM